MPKNPAPDSSAPQTAMPSGAGGSADPTAAEPAAAEPAAAGASCVRDPSLAVEFQLLGSAPFVIGMDEVGRGAIAGPVAVGVHAFSLASGEMPEGLRDSKLLTEKRREALFPLVCEWGAGAVGYGSPEAIDEFGISAMLGAAGREALLQLHRDGIPVADSVILLDGKHDWLSPALKRPLRVVTRVGADRACGSVAAASVRAKVLRDRLMATAATREPHYGWESNKGYGSKAHYAGIAEHGVSSLHRKTWIKK